MKWGEKSDFSKMVFQEVTQPERLVCHHSSTDPEWNMAANPMMPDWPKVLLTTVTLAESGEQTRVCLTQFPLDASEAEVACFAAMMANMDKGWGSGYTIIDELLTELKNAT